LCDEEKNGASGDRHRRRIVLRLRLCGTGNRAAIEIWVTFRDPVYNPKGSHMITLLETNMVTFVKGGLASKNVEYWNIVPGVHVPPPGWRT
jgi:hypothetical protein